MGTSVIIAENLTKSYRRVKTGSKKASALSAFFSKNVESFKALDNLNFEVGQGEILGLIGGNGAGKTTLLKLMARITQPSAGRLGIKGRLSALLEVGTGFHPDLTGRENILLNGSLLGMSRQEILRKMDQIIDFSGIEAFIDTQVKNYSSGMFVRLGFSVSAHLDADILLLDEVMAVGDAAFQHKSLEKVEALVADGKTVVVASHAMNALRSLCPQTLVLQRGSLIAKTDTATAINHYLNTIATEKNYAFHGPWSSHFTLQKIRINEVAIEEGASVSPLSAIQISLSLSHQSREAFRITLSLYFDGIRCFTMHDVPFQASSSTHITSEFIIPACTLRPGKWVIAVGGHNENMSQWFWNDQCAVLEVEEKYGPGLEKINLGVINIQGATQRNEHDS
ncbi:MAG: ABC transporter ATP-binding protein [Saprospiraceae bacterium]|nr:ABC transporter ATP-binding protein [Saprospiraceae bacterium]